MKILREPLLHFLLLGAAVFAAYSFLSRNAGPEPGRIVVTQGQIESLVMGFTRTWQRPPTGEELEGLVRDHVRDEVYAREAMALGLDRDDTVIRRRLRQKLEFVSEDLAARAEPSDEELRVYLGAHPDAFRFDGRFTFGQIYLNPARHGDRLATDAADLLARLNQAGRDADVSTLGDAFLLEHEFNAMPATDVANQFGESFAKKLGELQVGRWQGPIESGYGMHLVLVKERTEGRMPALEEVRDAVRREWTNSKRREENETFYHQLLSRYTVTIEQSQAAMEPGILATAHAQ